MRFKSCSVCVDQSVHLLLQIVNGSVKCRLALVDFDATLEPLIAATSESDLSLASVFRIIRMELYGRSLRHTVMLLALLDVLTAAKLVAQEWQSSWWVF